MTKINFESISCHLNEISLTETLFPHQICKFIRSHFWAFPEKSVAARKNRVRRSRLLPMNGTSVACSVERSPDHLLHADNNLVTTTKSGQNSSPDVCVCDANAETLVQTCTCAFISSLPLKKITAFWGDILAGVTRSKIQIQM